MNATVLLLLALAAEPAAPAQAASTPAKAASAKPAPAKSKSDLETERQKTLYALGVAASENFKVFGLKADELAIVQRGLSDGVLGRKIQVDMQVYRPKVNELAAAAYGDKSRAALAHFAKEKDAITYPSGVIYISALRGTGASPKEGDSVRVDYEGRLADGTVFDSSRRQGGPVISSLASTIPCWKEGIQKMQVGGKARIVCPPYTAYGDAGKKPSIPPKAVLVFDVELLEVVQPGAVQQVPPAAAPAAPTAAPAGQAAPAAPAVPAAGK